MNTTISTTPQATPASASPWAALTSFKAVLSTSAKLTPPAGASAAGAALPCAACDTERSSLSIWSIPRVSMLIPRPLRFC